MILETFPVGQLGCNCTIVADETTGDAIVVDGGDGVDDVVRRLETRGLRAGLLVHTHAHIDHIADVGRLRELTGGRGLLHPGDLPLYHTMDVQASWLGLRHAPKVVDLDGDLLDGDRFKAGSIRAGSASYARSHARQRLFRGIEWRSTTLLTGDTLFAGAIGRWDLGGTSMEDIIASIHRKLMDYDDANAGDSGARSFHDDRRRTHFQSVLGAPSRLRRIFRRDRTRRRDAKERARAWRSADKLHLTLAFLGNIRRDGPEISSERCNERLKRISPIRCNAGSHRSFSSRAKPARRLYRRAAARRRFSKRSSDRASRIRDFRFCIHR